MPDEAKGPTGLPEFDTSGLFPHVAAPRAPKLTVVPVIPPGLFNPVASFRLPTSTIDSMRNVLAPVARIQSPVIPVPKFTAEGLGLDVPRLTTSLEPLVATMMKDFQGPLAAIAQSYRDSVTNLLPDLTSGVRGIIEALDPWRLPPNLRSVSDQVKSRQVRDFVTSEGIPLYGVPRAEIGLLLLGAAGKMERRTILTERRADLVEDCAAVADRSTSERVARVVPHTIDALEAMRHGCYHSAQALFTLILDTLVSEFHPDDGQRKAISKRSRDTPEIPAVLREMMLRESYLWLPVWNSHLEFWQKKGHPVPEEFSRHGSVHAVGEPQYNTANCVQVMMLVASLLAYAEEPNWDDTDDVPNP